LSLGPAGESAQFSPKSSALCYDLEFGEYRFARASTRPDVLMKKTLLNRLGPHLLTALKNGFGAWVFVVKLTIPAMILTRLLLYFDLIPYVAAVFEPLMTILGLPAEGALIWVASLLANVYVGVTVYVSLIPIMEPWTLAQITTMGAMILLAHSLIVEGPSAGPPGSRSGG
jgi:Uncharacterized protein conserved in archaea